MTQNYFRNSKSFMYSHYDQHLDRRSRDHHVVYRKYSNRVMVGLGYKQKMKLWLIANSLESEKRDSCVVS